MRHVYDGMMRDDIRWVWNHWHIGFHICFATVFYQLIQDYPGDEATGCYHLTEIIAVEDRVVLHAGLHQGGRLVHLGDRRRDDHLLLPPHSGD